MKVNDPSPIKSRRVMTELNKNQKKQSRIIVIIQLAITLLFSKAYLSYFEPIITNFILVGLISVIVNILIYFYTYFKIQKKTGKNALQNSTIIFGGLTQAIPFSIYYILIATLLAGWRIPFNY
jgi:hypothetical protein